MVVVGDYGPVFSECLTESDTTPLEQTGVRSDPSPTQLWNMCWIISESPGETIHLLLLRVKTKPVNSMVFVPLGL